MLNVERPAVCMYNCLTLTRRMSHAGLEIAVVRRYSLTGRSRSTRCWPSSTAARVVSNVLLSEARRNGELGVARRLLMLSAQPMASSQMMAPSRTTANAAAGALSTAIPSRRMRRTSAKSGELCAASGVATAKKASVTRIRRMVGPRSVTTIGQPISREGWRPGWLGRRRYITGRTACYSDHSLQSVTGPSARPAKGPTVHSADSSKLARAIEWPAGNRPGSRSPAAAMEDWRMGSVRVVRAIALVLVVTTATTVPCMAAAKTAVRPLAEVPFMLFQNAIIVPAVVNQRDTVRLLLDTGWGPLALLSSSVERLGLAVDTPGADGLGHAHVGTLAVGGVVTTKPLVEVFPSESLAPLIGPHDGVLSTAFFRDKVLQIDYPARVVRFFERSPVVATPTAATARVTVPMVFSPQAGALPFTDSVYVDGRAVRALFDTGGAGAFVAMPQMVERMHLQALPDSGHIGVGMLSNDTTVQARVHFARVGRVRVGPFAVDSPAVMMAPAQMGGGDWGHDLVIGYGFMRNYVVTFDYPGRMVTLERSSAPPASSP